MKKSLIRIILGLLISGVSYADQTVVLNKNNVSFAPVQWHLEKNGKNKLYIHNATTQLQHLQVTVISGAVDVDILGGSSYECNRQLTAGDSVICDMPISSDFTISIGTHDATEANGFYQVEK